MYTPSKKYGLVKSSAYRKWISKNLSIFEDGLDSPEFYPVEIEIKVMEGYGFHHKADIDNCVKPILDLLVKAKILPDDNHHYVDKINVVFMPFWTKKSEAITTVSYVEILPEIE